MVRVVNSLFADYLEPTGITDPRQNTIRPIAQQTYQEPLAPVVPTFQQAPQPVMATEQKPVMPKAGFMGRSPLDFLEAAETGARVTADPVEKTYEGDNRPTYIKERTGIDADTYNQFLSEFDDAVAQSNLDYRQATLQQRIEQEATGTTYDPQERVLQNQALQGELFRSAVSDIADKYGIPLSYTTKGGERWELNNNGKYTRVTRVGGLDAYIPALIKAGITTAATFGISSFLSAPVAGSTAAATAGSTATGLGLNATTADIVAGVLTAGATSGWDAQEMLAAAVTAGIPIENANAFVEGAIKSGASTAITGGSVDDVLKSAVLGGVSLWGTDKFAEWVGGFGDASQETIDALQDKIDINDRLEKANTLLNTDASIDSLTAIATNQSLRDQAAAAIQAGGEAIEEVVVTAKRLYPDISSDVARTLIQQWVVEDAPPTVDIPEEEAPIPTPEAPVGEVVVTNEGVSYLDADGNPVPNVYQRTLPSGEVEIYFSGMPEFSPTMQSLLQSYIDSGNVDLFKENVISLLSGYNIVNPKDGTVLTPDDLFAKTATPIETTPIEEVIPPETTEETPTEIPETSAVVQPSGGGGGGGTTAPTIDIEIDKPAIQPPTVEIVPDVTGTTTVSDAAPSESTDSLDTGVNIDLGDLLGSSDVIFEDTTASDTAIEVPTKTVTSSTDAGGSLTTGSKTPTLPDETGGTGTGTPIETDVTDTTSPIPTTDTTTTDVVELPQGTGDGTDITDTNGTGGGVGTGDGTGTGTGKGTGEGDGEGDGSGDGSGSGLGIGSGLLTGGTQPITPQSFMASISYAPQLLTPYMATQSRDYLAELLARLQR